MARDSRSFDRLEAKRREQTPQALARLSLLLLFIGLWTVLWAARIPMPLPFLLLLIAEVAFFLIYWRAAFLLRSARAIDLAHYGMLAAEIAFHTTMVYFLGGVSWLGAFAYVFGLIFANTYLDPRRGFIYTAGASLAFIALILLEATRTIPHQVYLEESPLRHTDVKLVATTMIGGTGVFFSIYVWVNWVGSQLRRERDAAVGAQDDLLRARAELQRTNEELEDRVRERTTELELVNAALRESEGQLRLVFDTCPDLIAIHEPSGRYRFVNRAYRSVLGYEPGELVGESPAELIHPDDLEAPMSGFREMIASRRPGEATFRFRHADGNWVTLETNGQVLIDRDGAVTGVVVISRDITERMQAEEALRESEARYRSLAENSFDLICETGPDARFSYLSPNYAEVLGYAPQELIGENIFARMHPDDQASVAAEFAHAIDTETTGSATFRFQHKNGEWRWFEATGKAFRTKEGELRAVIITRDITERKQVEEALRASEERTRLIVDSVDAIVWEADATTWQFTFVSRQAEAMLGYPRESWTTEPDFWVNRLHPEDRDEAIQFCASATSEGRDHEFDYRMIAADGRVVWLHDVVHVVLDEAGHPVRLHGLMLDITEQKRAEEAIRHSERTLKATLESTADGILVVNAQGAVAYANARFAEMWRIPDELLQSRDDDKLLAYALDQLVEPDAFLAKVRQLYGTLDEDLDVLRFKDGRVFERYSRPLVRDGIADGRVWSFRDITERRRHEEELKEQARRDPLTGVLNHAAIMQELRELSRTRERSFAVAMADVDGLKAVNDTYGHQLGDEVLTIIADALRQQDALVGRYGGDEFVSVLPRANRAQAEEYRQSVLAALAARSLKDPETGAAIPVVASLGLAVFPEEADTIMGLISLSDSAMYASRRQRPVRLGGLSSGRPLGNDRAAEMVGQMVPLLTSSGSLNDKLRLVAHRLSVGSGFDAVDVSLFSPDPGAPVGQNTFAQVPQELVEQWSEDSRAGGDEPHPVRVLFDRTRRPVIIEDPWESDLLLEEQRNLLRLAELPSVLVAPLLWGDDVIGTLGVASKRERAFTPNDAQFLAAVATQVTAIIRMATLVEQLQDSSARLLEAQKETVLLLAAAAEAHDEATGMHLQSVRALSEALALEIGYDDTAAKELGLAAVLHDIGKIRVPKHILASSGALSEAEWEIMKEHTTWGGQFLDGRIGFELASMVARAHHERWDGAGYPAGLTGREIPEPAQIASVADAFDAMISDRPYRYGRTVAQAVSEITACGGSQFSPTVVEALIRLHGRGLLPALCVRDTSVAA